MRFGKRKDRLTNQRAVPAGAKKRLIMTQKGYRRIQRLINVLEGIGHILPILKDRCRSVYTHLDTMTKAEVSQYFKSVEKAVNLFLEEIISLLRESHASNREQEKLTEKESAIKRLEAYRIAFSLIQTFIENHKTNTDRGIKILNDEIIEIRRNTGNKKYTKTKGGRQ